MGMYDDVTTLVCKRGEQTYPGSWMMNKPLQWDLVYKYWSRYIAYCKRHAIVIGRHEELIKNEMDCGNK